MLDNSLLYELKEYVERQLRPNLDKLALRASAPAVLKRSRSLNAEQLEESQQPYEKEQKIEIEDFIKNNLKPTFKQVLFRFIDSKSASDSDVYKKAGLDRKHFSKIRSNSNYRPSKNTVIALALALELGRIDTEELLGSSGYTLSDSDTFDLVIQFCLKKGIYDISSVNEALDYFSLKPLSV